MTYSISVVAKPQWLLVEEQFVHLLLVIWSTIESLRELWWHIVTTLVCIIIYLFTKGFWVWLTLWCLTKPHDPFSWGVAIYFLCWVCSKLDQRRNKSLSRNMKKSFQNLLDVRTLVGGQVVLSLLTPINIFFWFHSLYIFVYNTQGFFFVTRY